MVMWKHSTNIALAIIILHVTALRRALHTETYENLSLTQFKIYNQQTW